MLGDSIIQVNNSASGLLLGHLHGGAKPSDWRSISGHTWHTFLMMINLWDVHCSRSQTARCHRISTPCMGRSSLLLFSYLWFFLRSTFSIKSRQGGGETGGHRCRCAMLGGWNFKELRQVANFLWTEDETHPASDHVEPRNFPTLTTKKKRRNEEDWCSKKCKKCCPAKVQAVRSNS